MHSNDTVYVPLYAKDGSIKAWTLIDLSDLARVSAYRWFLIQGKTHKDGYAATFVGRRPEQRKCLLLHRLLLNLPFEDKHQGDHINRQSLDNRRQNLRIVTKQQNAQNLSLSSKSTSGFRGVSWDKRTQKWAAYVKVNQKKIHIGYYEDKLVAAQAVILARKKFLPYSYD